MTPMAGSQFDAQRGMALLAFLAVIALVMLYLFLGRLDAAQLRTQRDRATSDALALAKQALIGRATGDGNRPGSLPCPDTDDNGVAQLLSGNECPAYIGRLPWKTLGLPDLRDGYGERPWYALSRSLRDDDSAEPVNSQTPMQMALDGNADVAAIVFSPGPPRADQNGRPSNTVAHYLDGTNADGDSAFVSGPAGEAFNDRALALSRDELFQAVGRRVLAELAGPGDPPAQGLRKYFADNGAYPWADTAADPDHDPDPLQISGQIPDAVLSFPPATLAWLQNNDWFALTAYAVTPDRSQARLSFGSLTLCTTGALVTPCP